MSAFRHRIRVRYNECDVQGAVFNANYLVFCDVSFTELFRDAFGSYDTALERWGVDLVVAEANVRYFKPARFDEELDVFVTVEKLGTTSLATRYDIKRDADDIAVAHLRYVFVDLKDGAKREIPDDLRSILEGYG